jgi:predicted short-subunit dehydrogenase-like oxidoreductase (DUF2520 family)
MESVSIIGVGKMGGALAIALDHKGFEVKHLVSRSIPSFDKSLKFSKSKPKVLTYLGEFDSDVIFITTQDSEISKIAKDLSNFVKSGQKVFHTSGSLSSELLSCLREKGCSVASIHPLVSISDSLLGSKQFTDKFFCVEGDLEAVTTANNIVKALEGKIFSVETANKTLYHAAAVTACGHLVALFSVAIDMLKQCGLDQKIAQQILLPLVKSTVENLELQSPSQALTGTFARGDITVFENQIAIITEKCPPEILETYLNLAFHSLNIIRPTSENDKKRNKKMKNMILMAKKFS